MPTARALPLNPWGAEPIPEFRGTTCRIFEEEVAGGRVVGECRYHSTGRLKLYKAIKTVMKGQPRDTWRPLGDAEKFYRAVWTRMRELGVQDPGLHIYTAVGSALEKCHCWHGFFRRGNVTVGFDATLRRDVDYPRRAHVLVRAEDALAGFSDPADHIARCLALPAREARRLDLKGVVCL